jgi:hypothetical protein
MMNSQEVIDQVTRALAIINLNVGEVREIERGGVRIIRVGNTAFDLILGPIPARKLSPEGMKTVDVPGIYLYQRGDVPNFSSGRIDEYSDRIEAKRIEEVNTVIRSLVGRLVNDLLIDVLGR